MDFVDRWREMSNTEERRAEDLKSGDIIHIWCGVKRITAIRPYHGPHDFVFAICDYEPGPTRGISLCTGDYFTVSKTP